MYGSLQIERDATIFFKEIKIIMEAGLEGFPPTILPTDMCKSYEAADVLQSSVLWFGWDHLNIDFKFFTKYLFYQKCLQT